MPKPKTDREQFQRFKEAVKEFGADESTEALDRAFGKIVPPTGGKSVPPKQSD